MNEIQLIVGIITTISVWFTWLKWHEKHTKLLWNLAPFGVGFTSALWIALIFG